jgi:Xaa-Pro dipeptidase
MKHPNWVVLQITERCNLRCKMCYEWGENGAYKSRENLHDLSIGKIEEVFSDLKEYSVYYELFGGEPLLHPQFSEIMQLVKKYECKIDIPTNGTLLSKYSKEIVDAKVRRIWISLDGPEQINDLQRGKGVYKKATEGIKTIQEYKRLKNSTYPLIGVTFVLTPLNYMYLKDFVVNELLKLNLDYISIEFQLYLTPERYDKYLVYLSEKLNVESETVASGLIRDISDFNNIDLDILNNTNPENIVALDLDNLMRKYGAEGNSFDTIVTSGSNSSLPHATPQDKQLEQPILIDWGAKYQGYCSDNTRTMVYTEKQNEICDIVAEAHDKAIKAIKPGLKCCEIDKVARDIISEYGYGDNYIHSTGHSIGLDIHEIPTFSAKDKTVIEKGMVITVEPGIYLEDNFGVRLEDTVAVEKNKGKIIGDLPLIIE